MNDIHTRHTGALTETSTPRSLEEIHDAARALLDRTAYDYVAGGAHDERTLRRNREAYDAVSLYPRVLVDVSRRTLATRMMMDAASMPVGVAPTAFHGLVHPDAEAGTARAAGDAGVPMIVSTLSNTPLETIRAASAGPLWFQLYLYRDRGLSRELVARAEAAGYSALVLTVDAPPWGTRERDLRNGFALPPGLTVANATPDARTLPDVEGSSLVAYVSSLMEPSLGWDDVGWLREITRLPVLLKGILREDDAAHARRAGVDGVIVSNHGGRQLDGAPATLEALPGVVAAVERELPVFVDGGIRRGTDVATALALGASGVFLGRPMLWGLACGGAAGARRVLELVRSELDLAMGLLGAPTLDRLTPDLVRPRRR